jgi:hypothetical protein
LKPLGSNNRLLDYKNKNNMTEKTFAMITMITVIYFLIFLLFEGALRKNFLVSMIFLYLVMVGTTITVTYTPAEPKIIVVYRYMPDPSYDTMYVESDAIIDYDTITVEGPDTLFVK